MSVPFVSKKCAILLAVVFLTQTLPMKKIEYTKLVTQDVFLCFMSAMTRIVRNVI